VRALNVMHRGVMPHLTRAVLVMDWVAGCVDFGALEVYAICSRKAIIHHLCSYLFV
jgi:hypothetical protein